MLHTRETFCQALVQSADQIANKYNACCCSSRSWTASCLPVCQYIAPVTLFSNLSRLVLLNKLNAELLLAFVKVKSWLLTFVRWRHFV